MGKQETTADYIFNLKTKQYEKRAIIYCHCIFGILQQD